MTIAACFISRAGGGLALTGARWFDLKGQSAWRGVAPEKAVEDPARSSEQLGEWIIAQCAASPGRPEVILVLDADGSACSWMSAESGEPEDVRAAVRDALGESEDDGGASLAWMGTWVGPAEAGVATSVQGLTDVALARGEQTKAKRRKDNAPKQRMGVMSVPDLPVRLLLDQLDKAGIRVRRVSTVWHVLAMASAPAKPSARKGPKPPTLQDDRVVADSEPDAGVTVASVIIDDDPGASVTAGGGQLLWCWSQGGALLCAGSMRLRESVDRGSDSSSSVGKAPGLRLVGPDGSLGTASDSGDEPAPTASSARIIEVTRGDIGRLLTDWLGWSVQTGHTPAKIVVAGPASVTCSGLDFDLPEMLGVAAVGAGLGKAWPGAQVGASAQDDPIGAAMQRVVDAENDGQTLDAGPIAVDPRQSVTTLSTRPGRASRSLHLWGGLALLAAAAGIGVLGWRVGKSADDLAEGVAKVQSDRAAILDKARKDLKLVIPADAADPVSIIQSKINELNTQRREMRAEDPLLPEVTRFLKAAQGVQGIELRSVSLTSAGLLATAELLVKDDAGPTFLDRLRSSRTGLGRELKWDGRTVGVDGERRRFNLSGKFEDVAKGPAVDPPVLTPPAAAPPAADPTATPAPGDKPAAAETAAPAPAAPTTPPQPAPEAKP